MKRQDENLIEVIIKGQRHYLPEKSAKIAIGHFGAIEVKPLATPKEVLTKTLPPSVRSVILIEPPEVKVFPPDAEAKPKVTRKLRKK